MSNLRFGAMIFPYHNPRHDPTLQFEEDLDLVQHLDRIGFDEVWFGEHHSTGWQSSSTPELMALAAAERTKRIRLGLGVTSIPYHHPFLLADRVLQLDHLTRGRIIWGMGTGSVAQDASMIGLDTQNLRRMSEEGVEAIMALLRYEGPVSRKTDWFEMRDAVLQLRPYRELDIRIAAMISPSGPTLAGRHGLGLFQFGVPGEDALANTWRILQETAAEHGHDEIPRSRWTVNQHVYLAETEEEAREHVRWNLEPVVESLSKVLPLYDEKPPTFDALVDHLNAGPMLIGTPEMAVERIADIQRRSGGVGTYIVGHLEAASPENVKRSYQLFAREVMPHFNGQRAQRLYAERRTDEFGENTTRLRAAQAKATADYEASRRVTAGA